MTAVPKASPKQRQKRSNHETLWSGLIFATLVIIIGTWVFIAVRSHKTPSVKSAATSRLNLIYATHWTGKSQLEGLQKYLDEYTQLHPDITFTVKVIPYDQYPSQLKALNDAGDAPDIYQAQSGWGAQFVQQNLIDPVPSDIQTDIQKNYTSVDGSKVGGIIRGIPTELDNYALLYNKALFKQAGIVDAAGNALPPRTWSELVTDTSKLTKKNSQGGFIQYGFAALRNDPSQMVDPFISLLISAGGHYLSSDLKTSLFNSSYGVQALNALLSVVRNGSTNLNSNFFDFGRGTVGMVISPPWSKNIFKTSFGNNFESTVGVAPLPNLGSQRSTQYSWFTGVSSTSRHKTEAWNFLRWFTQDVQTGTQTTRYGDLLANNIGTIPSRTIDIKNHPSLQDPFTKTFTDQLTNSRTEPSVVGEDNIKTTLMNEIQAAWNGQKTAQQALDAASATADKILKP